MSLQVRRAIEQCIFSRLIAGVAMGAVSLCAMGQTPVPAKSPVQTNLVEPPAPLFAADPRLAAIDASVAQDSAEAQAVLKEDGLIRRDGRSLVAPGSGWIIAYQFDDATGAYAAYTYFRMGGHPAGRDRVNPTVVEKSDGELVFVAGTSVVRAQIHGAANGLLTSVLAGLPKVTGRRAELPQLPYLFPKEGLDVWSLRYALGPAGYRAMHGNLPPEILGWDKSAEVATAAYGGRGGDGTLTLLWYPTPQIAGDRGRAVEKAINDIGPRSFGTVKMRRVGPLVGVTSGHFSADRAEKLVQALHLNEVITFDQKMPLEFHAEVRKTATLLQNIALFSAILGGGAILLGLFLGGARAGIRVLQGKPAHTEPEFLTINLHAEPAKPLVVEDEGREEGRGNRE